MTVQETITVRCSCGKKLKAPAGSAGKKARCPACGNVMRLIPGEVVPVAAGATAVSVNSASSAASNATAGRSRSTAAVVSRSAAPATAAPRAKTPVLGIPDEDDGLGALYELSEQADNAAIASEEPHCPSCMSRIDAKAVVCTNCGFDTRTGKSITTVKEAPVLSYATPKGNGRARGKAVDLMAPQGSFIVGLLLASVFGVVCSVLWIVIMFVTGYEIGILATVVGWTVGLGMQIGQKGYSRPGGLAAATIAVLAIAGPKLLLLALLLALSSGKNAAQLGFTLFHPLTILFIVLGIAAAYRTANGSSS